MYRHLCLISQLMFVFLLCPLVVLCMSLPFVLCVLTTAFLPFAAHPSLVSPHLSLCCVAVLLHGGVSSGQSYPSAQYESGLQQRGQQGEQPGHQPRTLLHSPR